MIDMTVLHWHHEGCFDTISRTYHSKPIQKARQGRQGRGGRGGKNYVPKIARGNEDALETELNEAASNAPRSSNPREDQQPWCHKFDKVI
eukprot:scaffold72706_cov52-Attheya_sp.AAC.6